jgi:hypothetical protein
MKGMTLADALAADNKISERIDRATIERLTSPRNYLGPAPEMVGSRAGGLEALRRPGTSMVDSIF